MVFNSTSPESVVRGSATSFLPSTIEPSVLSKSTVNNPLGEERGTIGKMEGEHGNYPSGTAVSNPSSYADQNFNSPPLSSADFYPFPAYHYYAKPNPLQERNYYSYDDSIGEFGSADVVGYGHVQESHPPLPSDAIDTDLLPELGVFIPEFDSTSRDVLNKPKQQQPQQQQPSTTGKSQTTQLEAALAELVDSQGGLLRADMVPRLVKLMQEEPSPSGQSLLFAVLKASRPMFQQKFVSLDGLNVCNTWLENKRLAPLVLKVLLNLPVDYAALKSNGKIGRTVRKLSSSTDQKIQSLAKKVLAKWKKLIDVAGSTATTSKRVLEKPATPAPKKVKLTQTGAFGSAAPQTGVPKIVKKKTSLLSDKPPVKSTKIQILETDASSGPDQSKSRSNSKIIEAPMSADDIKKQKMEKKAIEIIKQKSQKSQKPDPVPTGPNPNVIESPLNSPLSPISPISPPENQTPLFSPDDVDGNPIDEPLDLQSEPSTDMEMHEFHSPKPISESNPIEPTPPAVVRTKPKKRVTWAPDEQLSLIKKFPRDKGLSFKKRKLDFQGVNYNTNLTPAAASRPGIDRFPPKDPLTVQLKPSLDWYEQTLMRVDIPEEFRFANGEESKQVAIQKERESRVFRAMFMDDRIPPTPIECEEDSSDYDDCALVEIPLEDLTKIDGSPTHDGVPVYSSPPVTLPVNPPRSMNPPVNLPMGASQPMYNAPAPGYAMAPPQVQAPVNPVANSPEFKELVKSLYNSNIDPSLYQSLVNNPTQQTIEHVIKWLVYQQQRAQPPPQQQPVHYQQANAPQAFPAGYPNANPANYAAPRNPNPYGDNNPYPQQHPPAQHYPNPYQQSQPAQGSANSYGQSYYNNPGASRNYY